MAEDGIRISEFKKALRRYAGEGVIDLDKNYPLKFNFQIHRLEDILQNSRMTAPPNRWSLNRICFLTQGESEIISGIYKFTAKKNTLYIIPARVISSSRNWAKNTRGYVLLFNSEFFLKNKFPHQIVINKKLMSSSVQPYLYLTDERAGEIVKIFEQILTETKSKENGNQELIAIKILELLLSGERLFEQASMAIADLPVEEIILKFIRLLDSNFSREHSVKYYAARLSMHPNHLNALIKKHTGISAKHTIQNRILLETKYLLHSTRLPIKEISNQMGFRDPNYFTTFFKRSETLSPGQYRANIG